MVLVYFNMELLGFQVYKEYLLWGLWYIIDRTCFGLSGSPGNGCTASQTQRATAATASGLQISAAQDYSPVVEEQQHLTYAVMTYKELELFVLYAVAISSTLVDLGCPQAST